MWSDQQEGGEKVHKMQLEFDILVWQGCKSDMTLKMDMVKTVPTDFC